MEFDFDVCVGSRQYLTNTSKLNSTLGTFNGKCPGLSRVTCERDLRTGQDVGHDVGEDVLEEVGRQVGQAEDQDVEDDAEDVEGDQGDQDLPEDGLQVHVPPVQDQDGEEVA